MREAFDTIDHCALIEALRSRHLPEEYVAFLFSLYINQKTHVNHSSQFPVQRGIKQGDILSAILFNCILDMAFGVWRLSLTYERIFLAHGALRLTNIQHANDVLLYAESLQ